MSPQEQSRPLTSTGEPVPREVDVVVVGLGPGGEALASRLAGEGLRVLGVERRLVGGECPYYGCIPTKMMIRAAHTLAEARRVPVLSGAAQVQPDWSFVARRIRDEATTDWDDQVAVDRLVGAGAAVVHGTARLAGPGAVEVDGHRVVATRGVVLNTGTEPAAPPIEGLDSTPYWTNRDAVRAQEAPASMLVVGGGPIGAELAQVFARFGTQVIVLEVADRILAPEEPEASEAVAAAFAREGIQVLTGVSIGSVGYSEGTFTVDTGGTTLTADRLLVAAGRRPNLPDVGLETVGLDPDGRSVETDEWMRAAEKTWAIGDITGKGPFTHMSMYQADVAARSILDAGGAPAAYHAVPHVTFTDPEVGGVGMTEKQARDAGLRVAVGTAATMSSTRGWIHGEGSDGVVKLVADASRGVLVGASAIGPTGGEVLSLLALAVHAELPVETLTSMIWAYPTFHRSIETAVADLVAGL